MARNRISFAPVRAVASADSADPGDPTNADGSRVHTIPAGVVDVEGAVGIVADVVPVTTGHCSVQAMFWNERARKWVLNGNSVPFVSAASVAARFAWGGPNLPVGCKYAYIYVTALTGSVNVYLGAVRQDGGA